MSLAALVGLTMFATSCATTGKTGKNEWDESLPMYEVTGKTQGNTFRKYILLGDRVFAVETYTSGKLRRKSFFKPDGMPLAAEVYSGGQVKETHLFDDQGRLQVARKLIRSSPERYANTIYNPDGSIRSILFRP